MLLEVRLDEGPLGEEEAYRRLDAWWAARRAGRGASTRRGRERARAPCLRARSDEGGRDVAHVVVPRGAAPAGGGRLGLEQRVDAEVGPARAT